MKGASVIVSNTHPVAKVILRHFTQIESNVMSFHSIIFFLYIEVITPWHKDMNFIFKW